MTSRFISIVILAAFGIALLVFLVNVFDMNRPDEITHGEFALRWTTRAIGSFIATVAALAVLTLAIQGARLGRIAPLIPALLAGLLLIEIHWSLALSLGALVVVLAVREIVPLFVHDRSESALRDEP